MLQSFTHIGYESQVWSYGRRLDPDGPATIYLNAYGKVVCNGRFRLEQVPELHAFHVFEEGTGTFEVESTEFEVGPGQMVVVHPGTYVRYHDRPDSPWRYQWFALSGEQVEAHLKAIGITPATPVIDGVKNSRFSEVFSRIETDYAAESVSPYRAASLAWALLDVLADQCATHCLQVTQTIASQAEFIMKQEFHRGIQVEEVARRLDVSRATLFRRFKEAFGVPPKVHLDNLRLASARELLKRGSSRVKDVADACGFHCAHYFSNAYKKRYGTAPSESR